MSYILCYFISFQLVKMSDFCLDRHCSGLFSDRRNPMQFSVFKCFDVTPSAVFTFEYDDNWSPLKPQNTRMFEAFARDCKSEEKRKHWAEMTRRTQVIVDAMFRGTK